jgi:hypothetical protein
MDSLTAWADERLASVRRGVDVTTVIDHELPALDGSDAHGRLQLLRGPGTAAVTIVDSRLRIPSQGIDSVMLHAFSPSGSTSPHLLSDLAVMSDGRWHFHVDLMPRVDLVTSSDYLDTVYPPLTASFERAHAIDTSEPIPLPLRLRALSSPWIVGVIAPGTAAEVLTGVHQDYVTRWTSLVASPPAADASWTPDALAARDQRHRATLFDDATDPVWSFVSGIVGADAASMLLDAVRGTA